ncbi:DUF2793 domain-containing protein [Ovoidimarina sediminis]|uniref:DUF2793 domain-containing protein n=1 Tax=Ovoidimarina sediminis TaxID=3079856 RepID=UPI002911CD9F|nr:DUF2793 domain-containing protein [Rhodophyticola sp. MJ-SS7]MDU8945702.1 DUF2793 domain-containing protein [Rhodophyticola sp. MJ-SS7]
MTETPMLGLPLVQPSQAQKHVTVNEALARIDALGQLVIASRATSTPPSAPEEGTVHAVPAGAVNAWAGQEGQLALFLNGGWAFIAARAGWQGWIADEGTPALFDGSVWVAGTGAASPNGAASTLRVIEADHTVGAGAISDTGALIPAQSLVIGITGRVLTTITGTATSWRLGIGGVSDDRYGSGLGLSAGSWARGLTSSPLAYYSDTALTLTGEGGAFDGAGGIVRLAVHVIELALPRA